MAQRHRFAGRYRRRVFLLIVCLLIAPVALWVTAVDAEPLHRDLLKLLMTRASGRIASYEFNIDRLERMDAYDRAIARENVPSQVIRRFRLSVPTHGDEGWFLIGSDESVLCFVVEQEVHSCVHGLGQRGADCRSEHVGNRDWAVVCEVTALTGTGIYGSGKAYFVAGAPFTYLGYLPDYEYLASNWYTADQIDRDAPTGTLSWNAEDRSDPETPGYIDRCITIKFTPDEVKGQPVRSEERCEAYRIDAKAGRIVHLRGTDSTGAFLMGVYEDVGHTLSGLK